MFSPHLYQQQHFRVQILAQKPGSCHATTKETVPLPKALPYKNPNKLGLVIAFDKFPPKDRVNKTAMDGMADNGIIHQSQSAVSVTVWGMVLPPSVPRQ